MKNKLPEGWKEVELGEVINLKGGYAFKSQEFVTEGIPIIRISNFNNNEVDLSDVVYYPKEELENYKAFLLKEKDILIAMSGATTGKIGIVTNKSVPSLLNQRVGKLDIINKEILQQYLLVFVKSKSFQEEVFRIASGCAQPNISAKQIESIKIPLPPLPTQQKIVSTLEKAEKAKEWRKEADELTKDFLKAVFMEMFGDENKFEISKLGDIARLTMGGTPSTSVKEYWDNGNINWMKSGDIKGDFIYSVPNRITKSGLDNSNTEVYPIGTVVIALNGQGKTRGTTTILKLNTTSNQSVAGILLDKNKSLSEYVHYNLKLRYQELRNLTGDNERSGLNLTILRNLSIILPPLPLQQKFASIVKEVESMKEYQKHSKEQIDNLFNALMQKAFKGEIYV
ncbi:MAG: Type I restriction modification DNA specificity domain protein [Candidatus Roizmanbacteria bacterium GW2011_GWA2_32_13]|uniref:Type I restriction modification DNA specificity domain protein n=1 Tax=Candidatus Roizmanbacteria bacterium GW2011_GWA2_32_13 TaxID=1618475 RepID=A0A0F9YXP6_9BACT|nr:MAG: Type I restriction modification DNA specificity domain protein [Candidatus Roizmanbacteria bacterium GW2011_GWA2_32_13]